MFKAMRKRTFRSADPSTQPGCVLPKVLAVVAILERINIGFEACIEGVASVLGIETGPEPSLQGTPQAVYLLRANKWALPFAGTHLLHKFHAAMVVKQTSTHSRAGAALRASHQS